MRLHPRRCKPGNRWREAMQHRYAFASAVVAALMSLQCGVVHALSIDLPLGDDLRLSGTLNTTVTAGVAMRMESRSRSLIGKANNDPGVCGRVDANGTQRIHYQACPGVFREQKFPAAPQNGKASCREK